MKGIFNETISWNTFTRDDIACKVKPRYVGTYKYNASCQDKPYEGDHLMTLGRDLL